MSTSNIEWRRRLEAAVAALTNREGEEIVGRMTPAQLVEAVSDVLAEELGEDRLPKDASKADAINMIRQLEARAVQLKEEPQPAKVIPTPEPEPEGCDQCAEARAADKRFCPHCGKQLVAEAPPESAPAKAVPQEEDALKCPTCGSVVHTGDTFCGSCGADFTKSEAPHEQKPVVSASESQPQSKKKKPWWPWVAFGCGGLLAAGGIVALIIALIVVNSIGSKPTPTPTETPYASSWPTTKLTQTPPPNQTASETPTRMTTSTKTSSETPTRTTVATQTSTPTLTPTPTSTPTWTPTPVPQLGDVRGEEGEEEIYIGTGWADKYPVSNDAFAAFVVSTGYTTTAESNGGGTAWNPQTFYGVDELYWYQPRGVDSDLTDRGDHPVTVVSLTDAEAYCQHQGKRLPTQEEWEIVSQGATEGNFCDKNCPWPTDEDSQVDDGWGRTSPIGTYEPSYYGFVGMVGNLYKWTSTSGEKNGTVMICGGSWAHPSSDFSVCVPQEADVALNVAGFFCVGD